MTEKKKETKKTVAKKAVKAKANTQTQAPVQQEDVYPAINIAKIFGISDFAFFMIKEATGIDDGTLLTMNKFRAYYKEIIEGR